MIELLANLSFPLESVVEDDIALRFGMRDFDGNLSSGRVSVARKIDAIPLHATSSSRRYSSSWSPTSSGVIVSVTLSRNSTIGEVS